MPTDQQLKLALARMLPEDYTFVPKGYIVEHFNNDRKVLDTELLHLCWLVEETLSRNSFDTYEVILDELITEQTGDFLGRLTSATWQQRTIALCKVKGIEVV